MEDTRIYTACVLDTETGGLSPDKCALTQISCQMVRLDTYDVIGTFDKYVKPYTKNDFTTKPAKTLRKKKEVEADETSYFEYQEKAMSVTGLTKEFLMANGEDINDVVSQFVSFMNTPFVQDAKIEKPILVGQNVLFDWAFLQHAFLYCDRLKDLDNIFIVKKDLFENSIPVFVDTLYMAKIAFANDTELISYKLENIASYLKVELVDAHSSMADVESSNNIFTLLANRMRNGMEEDASKIIKTAEKTRKHFKL